MKYEINKLSILERNNVFKDKSNGEFTIYECFVKCYAKGQYIGLAVVLDHCSFILKTYGFGIVIEQINGAGV